MVPSPYEAPMDIARGLQELAAFVRSCGFAYAAQLMDAAADEARKQIAPVTERVDREIGAPANPRREELVDRGVDRCVFSADARAGHRAEDRE